MLTNFDLGYCWFDCLWDLFVLFCLFLGLTVVLVCLLTGFPYYGGLLFDFSYLIVLWLVCDLGVGCCVLVGVLILRDALFGFVIEYVGLPWWVVCCLLAGWVRYYFGCWFDCFLIWVDTILVLRGWCLLCCFVCYLIVSGLFSGL